MQSIQSKLARIQILGDFCIFDAETDEFLFSVKATRKNAVQLVQKGITERGYYTTQIRPHPTESRMLIWL